jgi:hypothetical protein
MDFQLFQYIFSLLLRLTTHFEQQKPKKNYKTNNRPRPEKIPHFMIGGREGGGGEFIDQII